MAHPEGPLQLLLGGARAGHVDGQQELLEVDEAGVVGVEGAKHVLAEAFGRARGEEVLVDLDELLLGEVALRAVLLQMVVGGGGGLGLGKF